MLRIDFVTLFPEMVLDAVGHSILRRAVDAGKVGFGAANPRDFTEDKHRTVDDKPFGGGPGMLMMPEPVSRAIESLQPGPSAAIVMTDPTGETFQQKHAVELSQKEQVIFLCGHYEGIDDRIRQKYATHVFSIGDFVLTGGELPALVMADAITRLLPGVLGDSDSLTIDSHSDGLLSAPQYTKPAEWNGMAVPDVLRSGDHAAIERFKREQALKLTRDRRPDLFCRARLDKKDVDMLSFNARREADRD
ncbi:MAG: tRNA (guanosine(37)-N1)-methyltransferase TrmD [Fimbriimonadaceae bacterium]|nr:tRNA (guanosine(37)-N1)-methyltransferase TrmD [Fimbriimonadaceae bacterium]